MRIINQQFFIQHSSKFSTMIFDRAMAAALGIFFARIGALVGNTLFGYLIDDYCILLVSIIAVQLFGKRINLKSEKNHFQYSDTEILNCLFCCCSGITSQLFNTQQQIKEVWQIITLAQFFALERKKCIKKKE